MTQDVAAREPQTRRIGQIVIDDRPRCPTCGHLVHAQETPEGPFYEPDEVEARRDAEREIGARLTAAIMAAVGSPDPDDFGIAYRGSTAFSPAGLAAAILRNLR